MTAPEPPTDPPAAPAAGLEGLPPPPVGPAAPAPDGSRGCVTAAVVGLGIVGVIGVLVAVVIIVVVNRAVDEIDQAWGVANPDDYELDRDTCTTDAVGDVTATGTLRNTSDRMRSFEVEVRFTETSGSLITIDRTFTGQLEPGQEGPWEVLTFAAPEGQTFECSISEVRYSGIAD